MLVFDATPLIYLATVGRFDLLDHLGETCTIPDAVYEKVVTAGLEAGHADARRVEKAVDEDTFEVRSVPETELATRLKRKPNISEADITVVVLAHTNDGIAVIDDRYARATADTEGVETPGTAWLVLVLVKKGHLTDKEARDIFEEIIGAGWY